MRKYATLMFMLACALCLPAFQLGGCWLALLWLAADFLALSIAYLLDLPRFLGKRRDGTLALWSWVVFLPYHALNQLIWHSARLMSRERATDEVTPELVIGRRILIGEIPGEFANFVDLTAEFAESREIREAPAYVSFPILDAGVPNSAALRSCIRSLRVGRTFIHCAQGHGRTGLFSVALLIAHGAVDSAEAGLRMLQSVRPRLRLNREQMQFVESFARELRKETE